MVVKQIPTLDCRWRPQAEPQAWAWGLGLGPGPGGSAWGLNLGRGPGTWVLGLVPGPGASAWGLGLGAGPVAWAWSLGLGPKPRVWCFTPSLSASSVAACREGWGPEIAHKPRQYSFAAMPVQRAPFNAADEGREHVLHATLKFRPLILAAHPAAPPSRVSRPSRSVLKSDICRPPREALPLHDDVF